MGLSSKKTKSESKSETVATPTNPEWVESPFKDFFSKVTEAGNAPAGSYVAPAAKLQTTAFDRIAGMTSQNPMFGEAADMARAGASTGPSYSTAEGYSPAMVNTAQIGPMGKAKGQSLLDNLDAYFNPFEQRVIDTTLADFDENAGRTRAVQMLDGAKNSALGGSGFAIREGVTEGELSRARASADANLRSSGFDRATSLSDADATRRQQAELFNVGADNQRTLTQGGFDQQSGVVNAGSINQASQFGAGARNQASMFNAGQDDTAAARKLSGSGILAQLSEAMGGDERATISLLAQLGEQQRGIDGQQRLAPLSLLEALGGLYGLGQPGLFRGQTTNQKGSGTTVTTDPMGNIAALAEAAGSVMSGLGAMGVSDGRLKRDIETVGYDDAGRRWVDFSYVWEAPDTPKHRGVIAQEVALTDPSAVVMHPGGFLMVDYSQLGVAA